MKKGIIVLCIVCVALISCGTKKSMGTQADRDEIIAIARDYIDGWYEGNDNRMENALHPDMTKRIIRNNHIDMLDKDQMVSMVRRGGGKQYAGDKTADIKIYDICDNIATVATYSVEYVDYLHLGKINGEWKIINVLWCTK